MKRCYIAGPITYGGKPRTEEQIRMAHRRFDAAKDEVRALGYEPVSPTDLPADHDRSWNAYMRTGLKALLDCDAISLLRGFSSSRGARAELDVANSLDMKKHFQSELEP